MMQCYKNNFDHWTQNDPKCPCSLNNEGVKLLLKSETNSAKGLETLEMAAQAGCSVAKTNIGTCYEFGFKSNQDFWNASRSYASACEQGEPLAFERLKLFRKYAIGGLQNQVCDHLGAATIDELIFDHYGEYSPLMPRRPRPFGEMITERLGNIFLFLDGSSVRFPFFGELSQKCPHGHYIKDFICDEPEKYGALACSGNIEALAVVVGEKFCAQSDNWLDLAELANDSYQVVKPTTTSVRRNVFYFGADAEKKYLDHMRKLASRGSRDVMMELAVMLLRGGWFPRSSAAWAQDGVSQKEAVRILMSRWCEGLIWLRKAAYANEPVAYALLGFIHEYGCGVLSEWKKEDDGHASYSMKLSYAAKGLLNCLSKYWIQQDNPFELSGRYTFDNPFDENWSREDQSDKLTFRGLLTEAWRGSADSMLALSVALQGASEPQLALYWRWCAIMAGGAKHSPEPNSKVMSLELDDSVFPRFEWPLVSLNRLQIDPNVIYGLIRELAEEGDGAAAYFLGVLHANGVKAVCDAVNNPILGAFCWLQAAEEKGVLEAAHALSHLELYFDSPECGCEDTNDCVLVCDGGEYQVYPLLHSDSQAEDCQGPLKSTAADDLNRQISSFSWHRDALFPLGKETIERAVLFCDSPVSGATAKSMRQKKWITEMGLLLDMKGIVDDFTGDKAVAAFFGDLHVFHRLSLLATRSFSNPSGVWDALMACADSPGKSLLAALMLMKGWGKELTYSAAFDHAVCAAETGDVAGQTILGWMYECGIGREANVDEARQWYERAVTQNSSWAMFRLGIIEEQISEAGENEKTENAQSCTMRALELFNQSSLCGNAFAGIKIRMNTVMGDYQDDIRYHESDEEMVENGELPPSIFE